MDPVAVYFVIAAGVGAIALWLDTIDRRRRRKDR